MKDKGDYYRRETCRICQSKKLVLFLDLGIHPPSDAFLSKANLKKPEKKFPLRVYFCQNCGLVQLLDVVSPEILFSDYPYMTSVSLSMQSHLKKLAEKAIGISVSRKGDLVVDIGSNDGTLLKFFKQRELVILGVDPSNISGIAKKNNIETINEFFDITTAKKIIKEKGAAKIITGTNVFAHIDDLPNTVEAINMLLDDEGILVLEFPYLVDLISKTEFDTIYHEHLSYFSLKPLLLLFKNFDMQIFKVEKIPVHGGSIRVYVKKRNGSYPVSQEIDKLVKEEEIRGYHLISKYQSFSDDVKMLKKKLLSLLVDIKKAGKTIVADGAPAKGNTLLNYCQIGTNILDYAVEMSPLKQGLYTPGSHIPIYSIEKIYKDKPDYLLILPWNIKNDIIRQQKKVRSWGGKFIIPIPYPAII